MTITERYDLYDLEAMCTTKRAYRTEQHARGVAREARRKRGVELRVYQCPACGEWHITKAHRDE
jgi:hypothetical protein